MIDRAEELIGSRHLALHSVNRLPRWSVVAVFVILNVVSPFA